MHSALSAEFIKALPCSIYFPFHDYFVFCYVDRYIDSSGVSGQIPPSFANLRRLETV